MATKIWVGTDAGNEGDWSVAANWSPSGVPTNGDDVYIENSSQVIDAGLDQSAVTLASLNINQNYTGKIGTTTAYLQIGATKCDIGYNYGPSANLVGSGRIKLDLGTAQSYTTILNSAVMATETSMPPVRIICNHASTVIEVRKGKVGIAYETAETSTLATVAVSYVTQKTSDADVYIGSGVTLTTLNQTGGDVIMGCGAITATCEGGTLLTYGSGAITTLNANGGTITSNSTGTITTVNINGGLVDLTKAAAPRTVTTLKLNPTGQLKIDLDTITVTNGISSDDPVTMMANAA
ncbi:MAG: hypothetical protein ABII09_03545 [Planctomycetota bacterium]